MPVGSFMDPPSFVVCAPSGCVPETPPPPPHDEIQGMAMNRDVSPQPPPKYIKSPSHFPPSSPPPPPAGPTSSVERALLSRIASLEAQVDRTQAELSNWRELFRKFFNSVVLSPENCENFKRTARNELGKALEGIGQEVDFIDCSFPASQSNAPTLELTGSTPPNETEWSMRWSPNWSVHVQCSSSKAGVRYSVHIDVSSLAVEGGLRLVMAPDLSTVRVQFVDMPRTSMELSSSVTMGPQGIIDLPLRSLLERAVVGASEKWLRNKMVVPNVYTFKVEKLRRKCTLTDTDVSLATEAAKEGSRRAHGAATL